MDEPRGRAALPEAEEAEEQMGTLNLMWDWERMVQYMRQKLLIIAEEMEVSWDGLPSDVSVKVLEKIPIHLDQVRMSRVSRNWNLAFKQCNLPETPSLLLPSTVRTLVHDTLGETTYEIWLPQDVRQRGEFCGSYKGGWTIVMLKQPDQPILFNMNTNERWELPTTMSENGKVTKIDVVAAVLSASPSAHGDYLVGAILSANRRHYMGICGHGSEHWLNVFFPKVDILDLIYFRECFYFLTRDSYLHVLHQDMHTVIQLPSSGWINIKHYKLGETGSIQYYLLQVGQDLYKVAKYGGADWRTYQFNVFQLSERINQTPIWSHQPEGFVGRTVFLGLASSRAVQVVDSQMIKFYDDRELRVLNLPHHFDQTDTGSYSFADSVVHHWPPAGGEGIPPSSDRASPACWYY